MARIGQELLYVLGKKEVEVRYRARKSVMVNVEDDKGRKLLVHGAFLFLPNHKPAFPDIPNPLPTKPEKKRGKGKGKPKSEPPPLPPPGPDLHGNWDL